MPTPASGAISLGSVASISKANYTATSSLGEWWTRQLAGISSGEISLSQLRNKPAPGQNSYLAKTGVYTIVIPPYQYFSVDVYAASGSGGGGSDHWPLWYFCGGSAGEAGGDSVFYSAVWVQATGGGGGPAGGQSPVGNGQDGTGSGGDLNSIYFAGGVGGFGSGLNNAGSPQTDGGRGGYGGRAKKTWVYNSTPNFVEWTGSYNIAVGFGGKITYDPGAGVIKGIGQRRVNIFACGWDNAGNGSPGTDGIVYVSWS